MAQGVPDMLRYQQHREGYPEGASVLREVRRLQKQMVTEKTG